MSLCFATDANKWYLAKEIYFECLESRVKDCDDYILTYNGQTLSGSVRLINPTIHVAQQVTVGKLPPRTGSMDFPAFPTNTP